MRFGVFLPVSGRAASSVLMDAAQEAEDQGFDSVWAADRIVIPWEIRTPYPYKEDQQFLVPPDRPFLEPLTCLAFLAGGTRRIGLGMSVMVLPYRHPLHWAKIATTIDQLSRGRLILGIGVGWMREEFDALGAPFDERGQASDEQLALLERLWRDEHVTFEGRYYRVHDIAFQPKPFQSPRLPIWVGGEGVRAQRRAGRHGDAWFPYFVRVTPDELRARYETVRRTATDAGRDPETVRLACCLPVDLTERPAPQEPDRLRGTPDQVAIAIRAFERVGVEHMALQFMVPSWRERQGQIAAFAREVMPALRGAA